jgi:tripartite-type tricarboxylate transporter receptor subunit TctC
LFKQITGTQIVHLPYKGGGPALMGVATGAWTALLAPRDTPPAIIARLNAATNAALNAEPMKSALANLGAQARGGTPQDLADHIQIELKKWAPIVQALNLKAE